MQENISNNGDKTLMVSKCYFCNESLHDNSTTTRMYDGRSVVTCAICRGLVTDARKPKTASPDFSSNEFLANLEVRVR